ncbi:MAG: AAA family ATPase [Acidobacteria bacterium]|nr:AAA family ATPase [Acidobacteriota bacterium]
MSDPNGAPAIRASDAEGRSGRDLQESAKARTEMKAPVSGELEAWRRRPLYGAFYGLAEPPFDLTPNPRFLFLSPRQREALSNLRYALATSKGFTLILGEAGTGKTTLVRTALSELGDTPSRYVLVSNPTLSRGEFYDYLAREFELSEEARYSKTRFLTDLQQEVEARFAAGGLTGLIIDEAQSLPHELLEEIRLLGNIETTTTKLLNIVLSGQPELADRLNDSSLRQLKQRVALRCELRPLTLDETAAYISGRLRIAGGLPGEIFTRETVIAIHEISTGIPRTINVLCDNALIGGFAAQVRPIPVEIVEDVCRDFDLGTETGAKEPAPAPPMSSALPPKAVGDAGPPTAPAKSATPIDRPMFGSINPPPRKRRFSFF